MSVDILGVGTELNPNPASTGVLASHVEVPPAKYDFFGNTPLTTKIISGDSIQECILVPTYYASIDGEHTLIARHGNSHQPNNIMNSPTVINIIWSTE